MKQLASDDAKEQEKGKLLADKILEGKCDREFSEMAEIRIKNERTLINKVSTAEQDPNKMSQGKIIIILSRESCEKYG